MTDVFEHNPGDHEDPVAGPTWIVAFLGMVLLSVIVLGITAVFYNAQTQEETVKVVVRDPAELENLRTAQLARITAAPHWVEEPAPVPPPTGQPQPQPQPQTQTGAMVKALTIPIDQAMELVVKEMGQSK